MSIKLLFLTLLCDILDMQTVEIRGRAPPAAAYLEFTEGHKTAYTFLTTGPYTGSLNIFNELHLKISCSKSICPAEKDHY